MLSKPPGFLTRIEGGWHCQIFAEKNKHLNPLALAPHEIGGQVNAMRKARRSQGAAASQEILALDPVLFTRPDGTMMEPMEARRSENLIRSLDACYGRRLRTKAEFIPTLLQNAWRACKDFSEEEINRVCALVRKHGQAGHPALARTTEELLEKFEGYVGT